MRLVHAIAVLCLIFLTAPALAVQPHEMLDDPVQEKRAQALGKELRCLVCQSESIEDSNSDLAGDLRVLVREKIEEGLTDQEIKDFLVDRYGLYVLLNPPAEGSTLWLWLAPGILVAMGGAGLVVFLRQRGAEDAQSHPTSTPLSAEEQARLKRLNDQDGAA